MELVDSKRQEQRLSQSLQERVAPQHPEPPGLKTSSRYLRCNRIVLGRVAESIGIDVKLPWHVHGEREGCLSIEHVQEVAHLCRAGGSCRDGTHYGEAVPDSDELGQWNMPREQHPKCHCTEKLSRRHSKPLSGSGAGRATRRSGGESLQNLWLPPLREEPHDVGQRRGEGVPSISVYAAGIGDNHAEGWAV